jgi:transposase
MASTIKQLPPETRYTLRCLLRELDMVEGQIQRIERRMKKVFSKTETVERLMTIPGIGFILAVAISNQGGRCGWQTPGRSKFLGINTK